MKIKINFTLILHAEMKRSEAHDRPPTIDVYGIYFDCENL